MNCAFIWIVKIRNTSEAVLRPHLRPLDIILTVALWALISMMALGRTVALIPPPLCFLYKYFQRNIIFYKQLQYTYINCIPKYNSMNWVVDGRYINLALRPY